MRRRLSRLKPWVATLAFWLGILVGALFASQTPNGTRFSLNSIVAGLVYLSWPMMIVSEITAHQRGHLNLLRMTRLGFVVALGAMVASVSIDPNGWMIVAVHLLGLASVVVVHGCATVALVGVESGGRQPFNRYVGTFLQFYFIPIAVWWVQVRIRKALEVDSEMMG